MDPASGLVEGLGGKFHDVEGTQYGCGVIEVIIDSVLVIAKRVQRGDLDLLPLCLAALLEPDAIHGSGAAQGHV